MSNTLKPLTNTQTVRGRPTPNNDNERAFRKGSANSKGISQMLQSSSPKFYRDQCVHNMCEP